MLRHGAGPGVPEDTGQVECYGMWRFFCMGIYLFLVLLLGVGVGGRKRYWFSDGPILGVTSYISS